MNKMCEHSLSKPYMGCSIQFYTPYFKETKTNGAYAWESNLNVGIMLYEEVKTFNLEKTNMFSVHSKSQGKKILHLGL